MRSGSNQAKRWPASLRQLDCPRPKPGVRSPSYEHERSLGLTPPQERQVATIPSNRCLSPSTRLPERPRTATWQIPATLGKTLSRREMTAETLSPGRYKDAAQLAVARAFVYDADGGPIRLADVACPPDGAIVDVRAMAKALAAKIRPLVPDAEPSVAQPTSPAVRRDLTSFLPDGVPRPLLAGALHRQAGSKDRTNFQKDASRSALQK